ncbi:hypothetical protein METP2_02356 [Methanosarcinales archaeon]|nr:hypothetical protein [Candidatus Methanoperedens sp.]CAG0987432.1 hypothetical protein METP2_02356 [Methanosarcinales archaeon]
MKNVNFNTALSAAILVLALLFIAGTASAAIGDNDLDRSLIINGTNETQPLRTGQNSSQSAGGYITQIDLYQQTNQTQNWQGYFGNVSGIITLSGSNGTEMYNWTVNVTNRSIYAIDNSTFTAWDTLFEANITNLDQIWFGGEVMPDTIKNTYKTGDGNRTFVDTSINASHVHTTNGFLDHVIQSVNTTATVTKGEVLWAAVVVAPKLNYKSTYSNYELLVPVNRTSPNVYYFYMELP